jgi:hypothetical protein
MSLYAVVSNKTEPVPLSELVFPARIYFIVSDINHGALLNISLNIYDADGELGNETFDLPFVLNYQDKYFYSCTHRLVQSIGDSESTPTPTPEKTPTPTPEKTPTPTPEKTPTPTPEKTPTPTPEKTPTPTPEKTPTPTPEKTPTPTPTPSPTPTLVCTMEVGTGFFASWPAGTPVTHEAGGTYYWGAGTQYTDPGMHPYRLIDSCDVDVSANVVTTYWTNHHHYSNLLGTEITGVEIDKLGLVDGPTVLGSAPYKFGVFYEVTSSTGEVYTTGRAIWVYGDDQFPESKLCSAGCRDTGCDPHNPVPCSTPTPTSGGDVTQEGQLCVDGITIENDEISFGIELRDSPGQIIVDPKDYVPSPAIPIVVYIFIHSATTENYCGKITLNSRNEGISETSFNNTTFSYLHSDDQCYNYDLNGVTGNDNFIVFGESVSEKLETCCGGLEVISAESNSNAGVQLSDATGFLCYDAKTFNYSPGLPTIVYIYLNDTDPSSYQGKITIENRVGGLSLDNFNSLEFVYIDSDDTCYKSDFSDINELNNIKIFNTYN